METIIAGTFVLGAGSLFLAALAYFLPWIIALLRGTRSNVGIFFINLLFGWTMIGWVIALIWALVAERKSNAQVIIIKETK
ncbi:Imm immunity to superinfection membrane protein [Escherichia phage vB_EcoM_VR7]|uniref:Imm immunity to superinfection membrane protein n=1 Tax=Escherichia phage vB_EcoM_VR7 TaxID=700939 RepID=E5FIG5_9CAUD|nr:immunity to superinfection [Escherichia phage vB_EcoM_VR7]ADR32426.1 Imm immunity to superinfection membrane protein [Escherichia phage vB_EcoM_VR7]